MAEIATDHALIERWALAYLGRYASSAANLRQVLLRRVRRETTDPAAARDAAPVIDALIERYRQSGLLDDAAYAAARARALQRRGGSLRAIRAGLAAKGLAAADAAAAVAGLGVDGDNSTGDPGGDSDGDPDLAAACAFARRRRLGPFRRAAADPQRELAAFARAGFARRTAKAVLACSDEAAVAALSGRAPR